ncbi:MAG: hypothetical protein SWY16_10215 [Cyanobacteriota bacterium]|nr:hypothetical protein [Cyanobacteriota bacterium]
MPLQPLQPAIDERVCASGDVTIHPSAAIASGVILQASPDSRIEIAAGACVGMGAIVHSSRGRLTIGAGANLGAGVLVVGECSIGENACIGAATTIYNASVAPREIVPPGSLVGDSSRQIELEETSTPAIEEPEPEIAIDPPEPSEAEDEPDSPDPSSNGFHPQSSSTEIYGQVHVQRIFTSLFPSRPSVNPQPPEDSSDTSS